MDGTIQENLDAVFNRIKIEYKRKNVPLRHRYPTLRVAQYKSGKVGHLAKLKGSGMQCKWLAAVLPAVFYEFMDKDNSKGQKSNHEKVYFMLKCIRESNEIITAKRLCFRYPAAASDRLIQLSFAIAQCATALIRAYHPDVPCFHFTLKTHLTLHIALSTKYTNPSMWDCSSGEDFMKICRRAIRGAMAGNRIHRTGCVALSKYLKALHVDWFADAAWWKLVTVDAP